MSSRVQTQQLFTHLVRVLELAALQERIFFLFYFQSLMSKWLPFILLRHSICTADSGREALVLEDPDLEVRGVRFSRIQ